jgi:hypothetical protein
MTSPKMAVVIFRRSLQWISEVDFSGVMQAVIGFARFRGLRTFNKNNDPGEMTDAKTEKQLRQCRNNSSLCLLLFWRLAYGSSDYVQTVLNAQMNPTIAPWDIRKEHMVRFPMADSAGIDPKTLEEYQSGKRRF